MSTVDDTSPRPAVGAGPIVGKVAFVGCTLMVVSFWFDGHTVSKGWRPLHTLANSAYNHLRLLPALDADPDDPELRVRLRSVVTAEAILLGFVVVVTAWLVAAVS